MLMDYVHRGHLSFGHRQDTVLAQYGCAETNIGAIPRATLQKGVDAWDLVSKESRSQSLRCL